MVRFRSLTCPAHGRRGREAFPTVVVALALLALSGCEPPAPPPDDAEIERLAVEAPLIFEGTVLRSGYGAVKRLPVDGRTATVRIGSVLRAPEALADYSGQTVTVLLAGPLAPGGRALFFTRGVAYSRELKVRELGRVAPPTQSALDLVDITVRDLPSTLLRWHIGASGLVVVGEVDRILSPQEPADDFTSEHHPDWRGALIRVSSVEHGAYDDPTLVVPFPSSQDVMWRNRPRFRVGQRGVFILHRHSLDPAGVRLFSAEHEADFLPRPSLPEVRRQITELARRAAAVEGPQ